MRACVGASIVVLALLSQCACTTLPKVQHTKHSFPEKEAFVDPPKNRKYEVLGWVRSKVNFPTLDPNNDEQNLCRNYYNKSVGELVKFAKEKGGDAVVDVKSVVFLMDGRMETHPTPECADEGDEGQVLTRGVAVKWKKEESDKNN